MTAGAPQHLRCEYAATPIGLDTRWPRLSWQLCDERPGAAQTAYRVIVASEPITHERWLQIPNGSVFSVDPDYRLRILPLNDEAITAAVGVEVSEER